jgi:hypothetical protein
VLKEKHAQEEQKDSDEETKNRLELASVRKMRKEGLYSF